MRKIRITIGLIILLLVVFRGMYLRKDSSKDIKDQNYFKTIIRGSYLTDVLTDEMYSDNVTPVYIKIIQIESGVDIRLADADKISRSFSCPWKWVDKVGEYQICPDGPYNYKYVLVARQPLYIFTPTTVEGYWAEDYYDKYNWEE